MQDSAVGLCTMNAELSIKEIMLPSAVRTAVVEDHQATHKLLAEIFLKQETSGLKSECCTIRA